MRNILTFIQSALVITTLTASPAMAFQCGSGAGASCACQGRVDCKDMRRSEMCKGTLTCGNGKCTCTAAIVVNPGGGKGGIKGQVLNNQQLQNAQ